MADNLTIDGNVIKTKDTGTGHVPAKYLTDGAGAPIANTNPLPAVPVMTGGGNISAQTAATGSNWTSFASQACKQLTIVNNTGTKIEFRQGGAGVGVVVFDQSGFTIYGITNANQISIRRVDVSNTQVTVQARWEN